MEGISAVLNSTLLTFGEGQGVTVQQILIVILFVLVTLVMARLGSRRISSSLSDRKINPDVVQLINRSFYVLVLIVIFITMLDLLNVPLTAFAFLTGAIAIGVGFGAQNIINNFISGWILMWERPIRIGDFLEINDMVGTVEAINTRSTRLRRVDGVRVLIPNSQLLENTVVNWTIVDRLVRTSVRVGVQYGSDVLRVRSLLEQIAAENEDILDEPNPTVVFEDFADSSLIFDLYFWIETTPERSPRGVRSDVRITIDRLFAENGIVIAFPQRDIHIDGALQLNEASTE